MSIIFQRTKRFALLSFILLVLSLAMFSAYASAAEDYDVGGKWWMEGGGNAEKGFVRVSMTLEGDLYIHTETRTDGKRYITGYDLNIRIDASKLNINAWKKNSSERLQYVDQIPLPDLRPTLNEPFELPEVKTSDGLRYAITLESIHSGSVKIYGDIDVDKVGWVEIDSKSVIWLDGTERPDMSEVDDKTSGCNSGTGGIFLLLPLLFMLRKRD